MTSERSSILITPAQMTKKIGLIQSCERISRQDFEDFRGAERGAERGGRVNATLLSTSTHDIAIDMYVYLFQDIY